MDIEYQQLDKKTIFNIIQKYTKETYKNDPRPKDVLYEDDWHFSKIQVNDYNHSYSHIYFNRFQLLKQRFTYIKHNIIEKIQKIQYDQIQSRNTIYVLGTLYKQMKLKPSYFNQISGDKANYVSDDDYFYLEDPSGRIKLQITVCQLECPNLPTQQVTIHQLITGIVVICEGKVIANNLMDVTRIYLPELPKQAQIKGITFCYQTFQDLQQQGPYLAFISGINYNHDDSKEGITRLIQFFKGSLSESLKKIASEISNIFIVGNIVKKSDEIESLIGEMKMQENFKRLYQDIEKNWEGFDQFLYELSQITPVNLMPGPNDATAAFLPQPAFFRTYFKRSCYEDTKEKKCNVQLLTNPMQGQCNGLKLLGCSGENIIDLMKYVTISENEVDVLESTLYWGNIAPTSPDTLPCYPLTMDDLFVIQELPHLYFAGNCNKFGTKLIKNQNVTVRLMCIPEYSKTGQICIVNASNLECFTIKFE